MKIDVYNQKGEKTGSAILPKGIFEVPFNADLVHQAVEAQRASSRVIHAKTKTRSEVRGGGRKPWRQKGTGRARHGSRRSPLWVGGGVTFGPTTEKKYAKRINKTMKRKALFMVLSAKVNEGKLILLDTLTLEKPKTKEMTVVIRAVSGIHEKPSGKNKTSGTKKRNEFLLVLPKRDETLMRATQNLPIAKTIRADSLNVLDLLSYRYLLVPKESIKVIEKTYPTHRSKEN